MVIGALAMGGGAYVYSRTPALQYIEVLTAGAKAEERLPMIVALHGLGDTPEAFVEVYRGFPSKARIIAPRAPEPWGSRGFQWFRARVRSRGSKAVADGTMRSAILVARLVEELVDDKPTIGKPVVTGFSQGGFITYAVAVHHAKLVRGAVPLSGGLMPESFPTARPDNAPPIRALHGAADSVVPVETDRKTVAHLRKLDFDVTLTEYPNVPHTVSASMTTDLYRALDALLAR